MLLSFDTDNILYRVLSDSVALKSALTGGIYNTARPDNSDKEDITVNTISVNGDMPQRGTSNVNIHVADLRLTIKGQEQRKVNRERLRELTELAISALEAANVEGLLFWVSNTSIIAEPSANQHYANLRIDWNIQKTKNH